MVKRISFSTHSRFELIDVSRQVAEVVANAEFESGLCCVFVPHATAGVILSENEPGLIDDLILKIESLFPEADYKHNLVDDNARAHLAATFLGQSLTIPFYERQLILGRWQSLFFVELDGPRTKREMVVSILATTQPEA